MPMPMQRQMEQRRRRQRQSVVVPVAAAVVRVATSGHALPRPACDSPQSWPSVPPSASCHKVAVARTLCVYIVNGCELCGLSNHEERERGHHRSLKREIVRRVLAHAPRERDPPRPDKGAETKHTSTVKRNEKCAQTQEVQGELL